LPFTLRFFKHFDADIVNGLRAEAEL
jgi:hypothetical protein